MNKHGSYCFICFKVLPNVLLCLFCFVQLRPPEEYKAEDEGEGVYAPPLDVYMAGNVIYNVLTHKWLFDGMSGRKARAAVQKGKRSKIPARIKKSDDPYTKLLVKAIKMCWTHEVKERPSARTVVNFMRSGLAAIEGVNVEDLGVVKVEMPPLPSDHRYTDSDFTVNLQ
jgi:hypothetical protein